MNTSSPDEVFALAKVDQRRLERLARMAGRSPRGLLRFVLRDGFEAVEQDIRETLAAERDIELHGAIPNAEVMRSARNIIESAHARRQKKGRSTSYAGIVNGRIFCVDSGRPRQ